MEVAADPERILRNTMTPTIADVRQIYGRNVAESWLSIQINDLAEYSGVKLKLTGLQLNETARALAREYYYITLPEFMLFFAWFKSGHYGTFYGSVDPMVIVAAFRKFLDERARLLSDIEAKEADAEREDWQNDPRRLTRAEWYSFKPFKEAGYGMEYWRRWCNALSRWYWMQV